LAERILDSKAKVLITTDGVWRGEKLLLLKNICDEAADKIKKHGHRLESCIVVAHLRRLNNPQGKTKGVNGTSNGTVTDMANVSWDDDRDVWWHDEMEDAEASCYPIWMAAEDPLFILYTRYAFLSFAVVSMSKIKWKIELITDNVFSKTRSFYFCVVRSC